MGSSNRATWSRKRQTTLAFAPIASSSSPTGERSPARVKYQSAFSSPLPKAPSLTAKKSTPTPQAKPSQPSFLLSSDEEPIRLPSSAKSKMTKRRISDVSKSSTEESDAVIPSSPVKRRRTNVQVVIPQVSNFVGKPTISQDSESDIVRSSPLRKRRKTLKCRPTRKDDKERSESDEFAGKGKSRSRQHKIDLQEDLDELRDSDVIAGRTRGTPTVSAAKARRQQQLDLLKRRRAGGKHHEPVDASAENGDKEENSSALEDKAKSSDGSDNTDDSENSSSSENPQLDADSDIGPPVLEDLDKYEDDFIIEDDDDELGVPADEVEVPFEFTRHRYKRLKDHFKDVIEWMVHNKLNPAFHRGDAVYEMAFRKVKDEVTGLAGSQFVSSVWNNDFLSALKARPRIVVLPYPITEGHPCDACNRSKHPASYDVRFDGPPYILETLEPVSPDDNSEEDESQEEDRGNVDSEGNVIPNEDTHFYLGSYLEHKGIFEDSEILKREHWSHKKRTKYTNEVVDNMGEVGEIDRLWRDFNLNLKTARASTTTSRW
ncbi:uncharacterized protein GIQ15_02975 [Arthroderma uncinatum]|uniref:uncharacterized protein n=1 Tax=Arthroderma uncinatum TaxID=74035 RepID=UPI00144AB195|nr:uncharacterized protein GIQ15_02975 [Arthroderma uncinatum]KAF3483651.1 hypothetical protein GIQ15_02975 [Arthroderma uncinatum]